MATIKSLKADVSSVSPSSERSLYGSQFAFSIQLFTLNYLTFNILFIAGEASLTNIRAAIKEWQDKLCIVFKERRFEDDYVEFAYEGG